MLQVYQMSDYQRKFSMENFRKESALKVARRNATKTLLKSIFQKSPRIRLQRIEQSGVASSEKDQLGMEKRKRDYVKLKESAKNAKQEPLESSSESLQSEFTCSICNRQFRAKIALTVIKNT